MNKTELGSAIIVLLSCLASAGCYSTNPAKYFSRTPDQKTEQIVWVEEVRSKRGRVLGYLEKVKFQPAGQPHPRNIYYVYGPGYRRRPKGSITDDGWAYKYTTSEGKKDLGPIGITEGVRSILNISEKVSFYRRGSRQFHN